MRNSTIFIIVIGFAALFATGAGIHAKLSPAVYRAPQAELTEFTISGNQVVETVTCDSYFSHVDFQGYGTVMGTGCVITNPFPAVNGTLGNTDVQFQWAGTGAKLTLHNCRADSAVNTPGYHSVAINCTHIP